jgi:2-polyprenyl-3-methyl-5-hydroxy-6-metoxy-1,4-benzoquinol methylase
MRDFWEDRYRGGANVYGEEANLFLRQHVQKIVSRGNILCPGDGDGRNGLWLARQGFAVTSLDYSHTAGARVRQKADELGIDLTVVNADLIEWQPQQNYYDAVVMVFLHLPPSYRKTVHRKLQACLKSAGVLVSQSFHKRQLGRKSGGPQDEAMLYDKEMLASDFNQLAPLLSEEAKANLDEGHLHRGEAALVNFIAVKQ